MTNGLCGRDGEGGTLATIATDDWSHHSCVQRYIAHQTPLYIFSKYLYVYKGVPYYFGSVGVWFDIILGFFGVPGVCGLPVSVCGCESLVNQPGLFLLSPYLYVLCALYRDLYAAGVQQRVCGVDAVSRCR